MLPAILVVANINSGGKQQHSRDIKLEYVDVEFVTTCYWKQSSNAKINLKIIEYAF